MKLRLQPIRLAALDGDGLLVSSDLGLVYVYLSCTGNRPASGFLKLVSASSIVISARRSPTSMPHRGG